MNLHTILFSLIATSCGVVQAHAVDTDILIPVENSGFEKTFSMDRPLDWVLVGKKDDGSQTGIDQSSAHGGQRSLLIKHLKARSTTWVSSPVTLKIGQLYRLQGWIKTEQCFSDAITRYPTAVPACLSMASFPFTNHSETLGASRGWTRVESLFIATQKTDRIRLHLGHNGFASGSAWFDDIQLHKVENLDTYIPQETVRRMGPAYRYDDRGWIFVHIEGKPYPRGYQYGSLLAEEIVAYATKLANIQNQDNPKDGWNTLRFMTRATMLPGFDDEYQIEMKGMADGASATGARLFTRKPDLVDIACLNSIVDLGQMKSALEHNKNATSGVNFLTTEDELKINYENHKCSAFTATGSATADGRFVFGQIFMWSGYTGVHWNVIADVQPEKGHRFVHHTFPGGIHSGSDFYISQSGLVIGETTVSQTPYNHQGTPQSNRIRKAVQYANSIDDLVSIMTTRNNGQYTNEWPFANFKTNEIGIFLLGTYKHRLWRSSQNDFPGKLKDFYWCNNNNKDIEVRKEYIHNADNAPFDLVFRPWNRDIAFNRFFHENQGSIDAIKAVNLWASSPINRSHACDGKITTADMAEQLVFLAHFGKTTLREKLPGTRLLRDKPGAEPHLSLGYSTPSPLFITKKLQARHHQKRKQKNKSPVLDIKQINGTYKIHKRSLWRNTVYPQSTAENWLVSASAAYWKILNELPDDEKEAVPALDKNLAALNLSYHINVDKEGELVPTQAQTRYDRYLDYQIPRIRGTYALHQLRLLLGNKLFTKAMRKVYQRYQNRSITNQQFLKLLEKTTQKPLTAFVRQWIDRKDLPRPRVKVESLRDRKGWKIKLIVTQKQQPYHLLGNIEITTEESKNRRPFEIQGEKTRIELSLDAKPIQLVFNRGGDFPTQLDRFYSMPDFFENFHQTLLVYGTSRQVEANHSMALRWQKTLADIYSEILPPLRKDAEITRTEMEENDLMILGSVADNSLLDSVTKNLSDLKLIKNAFYFQGELYPRKDQGLIYVTPNPYNQKKRAILIIANSALQLYKMTGRWNKEIQSWAIFKNEKIQSQGIHPILRYRFSLENQPTSEPPREPSR
jgi:hypothetical protein